MLSLNKPRVLSFTKQIFSSINQQHILKSRPSLCSAPQNSIIFVRKVSTVPEKQESQTLPIFKKFGKDIKNIYQFPYISYCNWFVNFKWYALPMLCLTAVFLEESATQGNLNPETFNAYLVVFVVIILKSYLYGLPFINFVAHIFITPEEDVVLSYVNFYGSRVDEKFPKGDLSLQSRETGILKFITKDSYYMFLISQSTRKTFRINFKHGNLFDEELFRSAIGIIPQSAIR